MPIKIFTNPCRVSLNQDFFSLYSEHLLLNTKYGFNSTLLYSSGNDFFEPWTFANWYCQNTLEEPLIAINPLFVHPYVAAWKILSLCTLYKRNISINWITGAAKSDFAKMGDSLAKDERFERLKEHFNIVKYLLHNKAPLTFSGKYYQLSGAFLGNIIKEEVVKHYIAGESELTEKTAKELGIKQLVMLGNNWLYQVKKKQDLCFGLLLEETNKMAHYQANEIFCDDKVGKKYFELSVQNSDSVWKHRLYSEGKMTVEKNYSLKPVQKFAETPFFIGSYAEGLAFFREMEQKGVESLVVVLSREKDYEALANISAEILAKLKSPDS